MNNNVYTRTVDEMVASDALKERLMQLSDSATREEKRVEKQEEIRPQATRNPRTKTRHSTITPRWLAPAAACFALVLVVAIALPLLSGGRIDLPHSVGNVRASYVRIVPHVNLSLDLVWLSEEEIINDRATDIFYGTVKEIRNIVIDFNGDKDYRAIARIEVKDVYHGKVSNGDVITVLLPCPIAGGIWVEDTDVISQLRVGMSGIFMPRKYTATDTWEQGNTILVLTDIADYGFGDGERFAFLETPNGLAYAEWGAFPSLPQNATLDDVRALIDSLRE